MHHLPALAIAPVVFASPASAVELHYAPADNLERLDVAALAKAARTIDIAAYVLTDRPVIGALLAAAGRGVAVRVYFDGEQSGERYMEPVGLLGQLYTAPGVQIRVKRPGRPIMHLKSYCVDGHLFHTGSASRPKTTTSSSPTMPRSAPASRPISMPCGAGRRRSECAVRTRFFDLTPSREINIVALLPKLHTRVRFPSPAPFLR